MDKGAHVTTDMRKSMEMVEKHKSTINGMLKSDRILPVEGDDNDVLRMLDLTCGIDYYNAYSDGLVRGVASRWQTMRGGMPPWNTFTVRRSRESGAMTEHEKRKRAIEKGGEYPYLTMQGYVDENDELLSLGFTKTADLMEAIDRGRYYIQHTNSDKVGQASFYVVKWDAMRNLGYEVLVYERQV